MEIGMPPGLSRNLQLSPMSHLHPLRDKMPPCHPPSCPPDTDFFFFFPELILEITEPEMLPQEGERVGGAAAELADFKKLGDGPLPGLKGGLNIEIDKFLVLVVDFNFCAAGFADFSC